MAPWLPSEFGWTMCEKWCCQILLRIRYCFSGEHVVMNCSYLAIWRIWFLLIHIFAIFRQMLVVCITFWFSAYSMTKLFSFSSTFVERFPGWRGNFIIYSPLGSSQHFSNFAEYSLHLASQGTHSAYMTFWGVGIRRNTSRTYY